MCHSVEGELDAHDLRRERNPGRTSTRFSPDRTKNSDYRRTIVIRGAEKFRRSDTHTHDRVPFPPKKFRLTGKRARGRRPALIASVRRECIPVRLMSPGSGREGGGREGGDQRERITNRASNDGPNLRLSSRNPRAIIPARGHASRE